RSIRGECNQRAFEATASGALLFQEAGNREVPACFRDGKECVYWTPDNLEKLLEHYLTHEEERRTIVAAARARTVDFSFESLWNQSLLLVDREWPQLIQRAKKRPAQKRLDQLLTRTWQSLCCSYGTDPALVLDLQSFLEERPGSPDLLDALGL